MQFAAQELFAELNADSSPPPELRDLTPQRRLGLMAVTTRLGMMRRDDLSKDHWFSEPYFEHENEQEVGCAAETNIFGGPLYLSSYSSDQGRRQNRAPGPRRRACPDPIPPTPEPARLAPSATSQPAAGPPSRVSAARGFPRRRRQHCSRLWWGRSARRGCRPLAGHTAS